MEIKYLPEITPELDDYLILQKASNNLVGKVKLRNLQGLFGSNNGGDNGDNNGEEEVKRVFNGYEPTEKEEGLEWIELDGSNNLVEHWFWKQHPTTGEMCWKTAIKKQIITQQGNSETKARFITNGSNDIYMPSFKCALTSNGGSLLIKLDKIADFSLTSLKEFRAYPNNQSTESIYQLHQGNSSGSLIFQVTATPDDSVNYHLSSLIEYCEIRVVYSGGGGW